MLFTVRHKTYAGQVLDVLMEASSQERAELVAGTWGKRLGHTLVYVRPAVIADEGILAPEITAKGTCPLCGTEYRAGDVVETGELLEPLNHWRCPALPLPLAIVAKPEENQEPALAGMPVVASGTGEAGQAPKVDRMAAARAAKAAKALGQPKDPTA